MSEILDLSVFKQETLDIKLLDGAVLHLRKPTKAMVIKMMDFKDLRQDDANTTIINRLNAMVTLILNSNDAHKWIKASYVEKKLTLQMRQAIITAYSAWIMGIEKSPN